MIDRDARKLRRHDWLARRMLDEKVDRTRLFGVDLSAHSPFEILLELYLAALEQRDILVSWVGRESGIPQTTMLRWLPDLERAGLVVRIADPIRHKHFFVRLTDKAIAAMHDHLESRSG